MEKLKSAEEYLKDVNSLTLREELYKIGKQIQIDAIQLAVERCADEVYIDIYNDFLDDGEIYPFKININSILNVATKIKEELENGKEN